MIMRSRFDEQLALLNKELTQMGAMCEEIIALAAKSLSQRDTKLTEKIFSLETEIDNMEHSFENLCLKLLLQQQPVARDLRQISAAHKMITDMERIGDQAFDIAEIVSYINADSTENFNLICLMAESAIKMVTESVEAYVRGDVKLAKAAISHDDAVDDYFEKVRSSLVTMITEHPDKAKYALDLLMIAKYFERIGDHAVNIAEWFVFSVTGFHKGESQ